MSNSRPVIGIAAWRQTVEVWESKMTIFQIDQAYVKRLLAADGVPFLIPHVPAEMLIDVVKQIDALILTGGDDVDPRSYGETDQGECKHCDIEADKAEIALVKSCIEAKIPVLGACRGIQIINVAYGGTLDQEITREGTCHGPRPTVLDDILALRHDVEISAGSRLADILGSSPRTVNTTHHQAIRALAPGFEVSARAPDGTIEAIEPTNDDYVVGVQWHPEKLPPPDNQELFNDLVRAAAERRN